MYNFLITVVWYFYARVIIKFNMIFRALATLFEDNYTELRQTTTNHKQFIRLAFGGEERKKDRCKSEHCCKQEYLKRKNPIFESFYSLATIKDCSR